MLHTILDAFTANVSLIIAFMYVGLKLKEVLVAKVRDFSKHIYVVPFAISMLSIWVMHHPLLYAGMRIDLRSVPIFFISYLGGWRLGSIAILLPLWYRFELGGPTVFQGMMQVILLPALIGALFHRKKSFKPPYTLLNIKHMVVVFIIYEVIKSVLMFFTTPATFITIILMFIFELMALLIIAWINNDSNRNMINKKELEIQSRIDNMTNLYNLRYFKSKINDLITNKTPFVIAMFDVDYFKNYNDTHGHPAGDAVLRTIGQLLKDSMREGDLFARYGGEEFIICFSNVTNLQTANVIAERFRNLVETYPFYGEDQQPDGQLTISIGISSVSADKDLDHLIEEADKALYSAKSQGRNRVRIFDMIH
ncbi:GGDEF domain-containing protein [Litchfieldia salsa]|uniref:Diguanylate cyclase n=1 Tax=Litchfieldia salsa TaxID=930152 RepID=A0A1H0PEJ8_9BACI|nr:diguanylate cyclase [Litchfieldia salsa]SDP03046.1 diguanylate cyclase [Litchfieldia salsa]